MTNFLTKYFIVSFCFLFWTNTVHCKDSTIVVKSTSDTIYSKSIIEPSEIILKYREVLEQEAKSHREYLEKLYTTTISVLGGIIILFIAFVCYLLGKTHKKKQKIKLMKSSNQK